MEHMLRDYYEPSRERDREHFLDWSVQVDGKKGMEALGASRQLEDLDYSIHFHVFEPSDIVALLEWFKENICSIEFLEGPVMAPNSIEFHLLLRSRGVNVARTPERPLLAASELAAQTNHPASASHDKRETAQDAADRLMANCRG